MKFFVTSYLACFLNLPLEKSRPGHNESITYARDSTWWMLTYIKGINEIEELLLLELFAFSTARLFDNCDYLQTVVDDSRSIIIFSKVSFIKLYSEIISLRSMTSLIVMLFKLY